MNPPREPRYAVTWLGHTLPPVLSVSAYDNEAEVIVWEVFLDAGSGEQISEDEYIRRYNPPEGE